MRVLHYQEHLTKFSIFRPLCTKRAEDVADELKEIFSISGCPRILHSDNGCEFVNEVIDELLAEWPCCQTWQGRPRNPECQGSGEWGGNQDFENMMRAYLTDLDLTNWKKAIPIV